MKIQIETSVYNERRYGKPWIARVTFATAKGDFQFGEWAGQEGRAGVLIIDAAPGDIVARGQKDFRKPSNSSPDFYAVTESGELESISKANAYKLYQERQASQPNPDALRAERERLLARLAEIDEALAE